MRGLIPLFRFRRQAPSHAMLTLVTLLALTGMILSPIADEVALAQGGDEQVAPEEAEEVEQAEDPAPPTEPAQPTEPDVPPLVTEVPLDGIEEPTEALAAPTETPEATEQVLATTFRLTIDVYRCDHPTFDPYFSSNAQMVLDQCVGQGTGEFSIESSVPVQPQTGGALEFEIGEVLFIVERLAPGYDDPIANCFLLDAIGATVDQIGPGEANGGAWKVGSVQSDVHCDWYQVDRGVGAVYIVNMACPATAQGFPQPTMSELVSICREPAGAKQFFVAHGAGLSRMGVSGGEFNDVLFDAIQAGQVEIWMDSPGAFDAVRVFCQVNTLDGVEITPFAEVSAANFRATGITLGHGQRLHCSWFNILQGPGLALPDESAATTPPDSNASELTIRLHTCPSGFDPMASGADPMADCPAGTNGVSFALADADPATADQEGVTGNPVGNAVTFGGLTSGDYTVTQIIPNGIATVFVLGCGGGGGIDPIPTVIASGALEIGMPPGVLLTCNWFNVPGSASPGGASSEFRVALRTCPAGYDPEAAGVDPILDCQPGPNGIDFTFESADPDIDDRETETGDAVEHVAIFESVVPGDYTVTQDVPDDIEASFVLGCGVGGGVGPIPVFVDDELDIGIAPGIIQTCPWFNVPEIGEVQRIAREGTPGPPGIAAALTGAASLTMYAYACPAGFDVTPVDANPQASCALADGIRLEMDDSIDDNGGWEIETGSTGPGFSTIDGLAPDRYTIALSVRNGTTATFAWDCYDLTGSSSRTDPLTMGDYLSYDLADGAQVRCDWYQVTGGTGRVIVNSHACGILVPAYTLAYELLRTQCTEDPGTIDYTIASDIYRETQPAAQNPLTLASFANVPSGYVYAGVDLPDGWGTPIVYCQVLLEDGTPVSPPAPMNMVGSSSVGFALEPGEVVSCDWYNVIRGFVDVHVTKYACPEGVDPYAEDLASLVVTCTADPGIIDFTVEGSPLYLQTRTASAAAPASFMDVPSGQVQISEKLPAGYGLPVVYCRIDFEDGSNVVPAVRKTVGSFSSITQDLSAGQVLHCEWFNAPGGEGMVSIWKQSCPEGFDAQTATRLELELQCAEDIGTVDFGLTSGSFSAIASSTSFFRYADFNAVPAGPLTIVEAPQEGYDDAVAYCRVQEPTQPVMPAKRMDVANGTLGWDLGPNQWLICQWYNAHDAGGTVTVNKFECPDGTTDDHDSGWYSQNCTAPHNGIEFNLTHSGGLDPEFTANGTVEWSAIPLGPVSIQEYLPGDYGEPVVFCGVVSSSGGPIDAVANRVESPGGYVETRFEYPNTRYLCYWYNVPGGPGEVTIHKYTCPPGYDLHAEGADPKTDCPDATNGVPFTILAEGYDAQATTGDASEGAVRFNDLDPGSYTVTETVPPGAASAFVLDCTGGKMGAIRPYPLSVGETLSVEVGAGEQIVCLWYNVPEYENGRLTVVKYTCSTETYVSVVDCEIHEAGQAFDLVFWNGEAWEYHSTQTTDGVGRTTFVDLAPGEYWLDDRDREWCAMTSDQISDDGNWLNVGDGGESMVEVYNCSSEPGAAGKPGKTPGKYPNTGVLPNERTPARDEP